MKHFGAIPLVVITLLLFGRLQQAQDKSPNGAENTAQEEPRPNEPSEPADTSSHIALPAGTEISVRVADEVNSNHNHAGDLIVGTVDPSVFLSGHVVIPRGNEAHMRLMENRKGGHLYGKAAVSLELIGLVLNEDKLAINSDDYHKQQGALSAKLKGTGKASAAGGTSAATSATPEGGAVGPIIAVFRAAKIDLRPGTRIPFNLTTSFTFDSPVEQTTSQH